MRNATLRAPAAKGFFSIFTFTFDEVHSPLCPLYLKVCFYVVCEGKFFIRSATLTYTHTKLHYLNRTPSRTGEESSKSLNTSASSYKTPHVRHPPLSDLHFRSRSNLKFKISFPSLSLPFPFLFHPSHPPTWRARRARAPHLAAGEEESSASMRRCGRISPLN